MENATPIPFKDCVRAYVRVAGIFLATRYVWRPFGELLEVDRCHVDGRLVGNSPAALHRHAGHRLTQPTVLKVWEMFFVWVRLIR